MPINQGMFFSHPEMLGGLARPSSAALWRKVWQCESTCRVILVLLLCLISHFKCMYFLPSEILWKLLAAFDSSLSTLCSKFLPKERDETTRCLVDHPSSSSSGRWGTTFCLLLDLLELLTACSVICGAGICLESPRMTYVHSSALLMTISCPSEYFVKKRVLLLLKRAVLQKAGEDWALGEVLLTGLKHKHFDSDMSVLSQSVLTAVATDWLHSVQVESSSFFGGTRSIRGEEGQKPDCVMLRAVSLLLLKSMELHIQTAGRTGENPVGLQLVYCISMTFHFWDCSGAAENSAGCLKLLLLTAS
uniref:Protein Lines N-terminal domain-containing protein n=1 Tax=Sander lucioperca TaxID=283035 RepID=A0A8C9XIJ3_SANLU